MFACAMYPADEEFLNSVKEEVRYQVKYPVQLHFPPILHPPCIINVGLGYTHVTKSSLLSSFS